MALSVLNRAGQGVSAGVVTQAPIPGDTGWTLPGTGENVASMSGFGNGTANWANPSDILANDGNEAFTGVESSESEILRGRAFGFDAQIAAGDVITGVALRFERRKINDDSGSTRTVHTEEFHIVLPGPAGVGNKANTPEWGTSVAVESYGGAGDLWGQGSISAADVRSSAFGFGLRAVMVNATAQVDYAQMRVWYDQPQPDIDVFHLDGAALEDLRTLSAAGAVDGQEYPYRVDEEGVGWEVGTGVYRLNGGNDYIERSAPLLSSEVDDSQVAFGAGAELRVDLVGGRTNLQEAFGI